MANKSKFINIQQDPCEIVLPEEQTIDRVCPTCVPNPSYIPPEWWKQTEPWLNEKTCEYSVAVFVNQSGDNYRLSDLKNILDPVQGTTISIAESGIPLSAPMSAVSSQMAEQQQIKNDEKFDRIKRSFVKPGIRSMLRHYGKLESDELVCANDNCSIFTTTEAKKYIRQRKHYASLNSDVSFYEWARKEQQDIESLPTIDNYNALELFALSADYHFYGAVNGMMAVLVTIPAHIFDQVPKAPVISEVDTNIESVKFKVPEFTTWIAKMESIFVLFSKFQSYFKHTEDGRLFQLVEGEEVPFYAKFMSGRFERFEDLLSKFLESKGYDYYSSLGGVLSFKSSKSIEEIELKFDKSDENRPFKLADTITIKPVGCKEVILKLPPEPNPEQPVGDNIRHIGFFDQTLMGYIANYDEIRTQVDAKKNPPWIDFIVEHTFPAVSVNYGSSLDAKSNAFGCLLDKFSDLDDAILNSSTSFFESLAYQFNKNNCRLLSDKDKGKITVFSSEEDLKKLEKARKEQEKRTLKEKGLTEDKKIKDIKSTQDIDDSKLAKLFDKINPCNWRKLTLKGVQCLLSGMTVEEGYREIIKGLMGSVTTEGMEILLSGLPADKQRKVRETVEKEFKDLPAPWEVGYDPGNVEAAYDRQAQENTNQSAAVYTTFDELNAQLPVVQAELTDVRNSTFLKYLQDFGAEASKKSENIARKESRVGELRIQAAAASGQVRIREQELTEAQLNYEETLDTAYTQATINTASQIRDTAQTRYEQAEANEQQAIEALTTAEQELEAAKDAKFVPIEESQWEADRQRKITELEAQEASIKQQLAESEDRALEELKTNSDTIGFADKTPEEQQKIIDKEKQKLDYVSIQEGDKVRQGTYGRAVGNVQKELMRAYGNAIIKNASVQEILTGLEKLPGASIVGEFFASFDCPKYSFAYPPIDEFLGTFTLGACGKGKTRPFSLPQLKQLPDLYDVWGSFKDAFMFAFKKTTSQIVSALILKSIQALEAGICDALTFSSELTQDLYFASRSGGRFDRSITEILSDAVCGDQLDSDEKDKSVDKLFSLSGAPKRGTTTPKEVLETMSTLGSEQDYLKAMTGQADPNFLENVSRTIGIVHPDYASTLGTSNGLDSVLQSAGNYLSEEQRERAAAIAADPQQFFPLDPSICLTNDQAKEYYNNLKVIYANQIGDPNIANDFVDNQRDRARSDLADLADILAKGPEGILQDEIDNLFAPPDPDCSVDKSLLKTPEELEKQKEQLAKGAFARLQKAFIDDTVEENPFEFTDSIGILLMITADSIGYNYAKHMRVRNNLFFRLLCVIGLFDNEAPFPETVGAQMRTKLLNSNLFYGQDLKVFLDYENGLQYSDRYITKLILEDSYPVEVQGQQYHNNNFNYSFSMGQGTYTVPPMKDIIVENINTPSETQFISEFVPSNTELSYDPTPGNLSNNYKNYILKNYLESKLTVISDTLDFPIEEIGNIVRNINNILFGDFKNSILSDENGNVSNGFVHGGSDQKLITVDDLTYVDPLPGATDYTYDEDEAVLGRSLTNNPRVKFLDPLKHGGTYETPNIYIEPDLPRGWLAFSKILVPNIDGCNPRATNFLQLEQLENEMATKEDKIKPSEKLSQSPECVDEIPFEKIASPASLAALEQSITATIRVYLTHFIINSFGIHGNLALNDNNYEELIYEYIVSKMEQGLSNERSFFASTYEGYTYWLLFLEQCAQVYNRKIKLGEMTVDAETEVAMETINNAQIAYVKPSRDTGALFDNAFKIQISPPPQNVSELLNAARNDFDDVYAYPAVGGYLISRNTKDWNKTLKTGFFQTIADDFGDEQDKITIMFGGGFRFWTQAQMNFSAKIATIAENEESCKVFLKRLIREQVQFYSTKLASELNPRPLIYDINKFFIGGSKVLYGNNIRAGIYDVEVPIGGASGVDQATQSSTEYYGTINHCALDDGANRLLENSLSSQEKQNIKQSGGLYLEKYLRAVPKIPESTNALGLTVAQTPGQIAEATAVSRPDNLPSGIQNIQEFIDFLNTQEIPDDVNISDWFGDAKISSEVEEGYTGSIGIKFGVRLIYIAPEEFTNSINLLERSDLSEIIEKSKQEKTFVINMPSVGPCLHLPLATYEKDIIDVKLSSLKTATEDFNQDLKCFIDGLAQSEEYNLILNKILNVKKIGSALACYSDLNFVPSIGLGQGERREPDISVFADLFGGDIDLPDADDRSDFFNDSRSECRKIFVSNYKRNDFDPPNEEEEIDELSLVAQKALAKSYAATALTEEVSWLTRRRIKPNKPTDKEGKECQNQFGGLFNIKR